MILTAVGAGEPEFLNSGIAEVEITPAIAWVIEMHCSTSTFSKDFLDAWISVYLSLVDEDGKPLAPNTPQKRIIQISVEDCKRIRELVPLQATYGSIFAGAQLHRNIAEALARLNPDLTELRFGNIDELNKRRVLELLRDREARQHDDDTQPNEDRS